jgi:hypothetical protein
LPGFTQDSSKQQLVSKESLEGNYS